MRTKTLSLTRFMLKKCRESCDDPTLNPKPICEHCGKKIVNRKHIKVERHSGPSVHTLHFHGQCWKCPKCGTNGPHYCPADVARS